MASSKIKGITVEIGGDTTKLGKAISDAEKNSKSLQGELKQVEKLLKMDPSNVDLLAQKQEILTRAVSETADKLDTLRQAQEQVERQFKNGDIGEDQYRSFQREIIKTENELNGFESELKDTEQALEKTGKEAKDSGDGFTVMKGALADMVANVITSAVSAIGDLVGSILDLSEATEEYRTMQAKLAGSADTFGYSVDYANEKYKEFYKYLGDDQASTNAITNLMGIGAETDTLSKIADGATGVWATYGDSIPIESLTESINETINAGKVTGTFADTINWCKDANTQLGNALGGNKKAQSAFNKAIKEGETAEDAFNIALEKVTSEQERADIVAKFLNETYGESKKTYDELNGSVLDANEAELKLKETQAKLGETVAPVNTALTNMKNQALQAITPLVEKLADGFVKLYEWLQKNPVVMKILTAVAIALATAFTILAGALAIQGIITGVTKAIAFLNTTLLANPIVLIIALIAGLVAGFIYLWNNCDAFREFWIALWEKIKSVASTVKDALVEFFTITIPSAWDKFKAKSSEVITSVVNFFKQLPSKIWNAIKKAITNITKWANDMKTKATNGVKNLVNAVVNWFKQLPGKIWTWLVNVVTKIVTWGNNMKSKATSAVSSLISSVVSFMKQLPEKIWSAIVGAVSRVATWGNNMKSKAVSAITSLVSNVVSKAKQLPSKIYSAIRGAISRVKSWGSSLASTAGSAIRTMINKIVSTAKSIPGKFLQIGKDIINGIKKGIKGALGGLYDSIKSGLSGLVSKAKKALGINSPSKVFADTIGIAIPEGIAKGIDDNIDIADDAVTDLSDEMIGNASKINGLTLNRQMETTFKGSVSSDTKILDRLDDIVKRLESKTQIILDTGTLVGETVDAYDRAFSNRKTQLARGW